MADGEALTEPLSGQGDVRDTEPTAVEESDGETCAPAAGESSATQMPHGGGRRASNESHESNEAACATSASSYDPAVGEEEAQQPGDAAHTGSTGSTAGIVRVTFLLPPEEFSHTLEVSINDSVAQLAFSILHKLGLHTNSQSQLLFLNHSPMLQQDTFSDLGIHSGEHVTLRVSSADEHEHEPANDRDEHPLRSNDPASDEISTSHAEREGGVHDDEHALASACLSAGSLLVEVDQTQQETKPYFGGYRSTLTGTVFHHASTQAKSGLSLRQRRPEGTPIRYKRETQKKEWITRSTQTKREAATQMQRKDLVLDKPADVVVHPRPEDYVTAQGYEGLKDSKAVEIQRWVRGWLSRREAAKVACLKTEHEQFYREEEWRAQREHEEQAKREMDRRKNPRTKADFHVLYSELEQWCKQETDNIKTSNITQEEKQKALQGLVQKKTRLLQTIDRLKIKASKENAEKRTDATLAKLAAPKQWHLRDGKTIHVHTPSTTRAAKLKQLYSGLKSKSATIDERLEVLRQVKSAVKEFKTNLTQELTQLIDREADLLDRGRSTRTLNGLRKRIKSLFLQSTQQPDFNPEIKQYTIEPQEQLTAPSLKVQKISSQKREKENATPRQ